MAPRLAKIDARLALPIERLGCIAAAMRGNAR